METLAERLGTDEESIAFLTSALAKSLTQVCGSGQSVAVAGFGTFETRKRLERVAVHPATGKRMLYPPKMTLGFRPSSLLRKQLRDLD